MPAWAEWITNILIVIVMLGVLISIHEAGHLATAKAFNVYCFEYSIGMGPKLFSFKRKKGETIFSVRAIPFGGYVMMYGERGAVPDGVEEPPIERSLNSIRKWKKCIVLVAGVTLNFILGLVLIYIGDAACPMYYSGIRGVVENETILTVNLDSSYDMPTLAYLETIKKPEYKAEDYLVSMPSYTSDSGDSLMLLSWNANLYNANGELINPETTYVVAYVPSTLVDKHGLGDSIYVFPGTTENVPASLQELGVDRIPIMRDADGNLNVLKYDGFSDGVYLDLPLRFIPKQVGREGKVTYLENYISGSGDKFRLTIKNKAFTGGGVTVNVIKGWHSFQESWQVWAEDVPTACTAIVKGFASLFTPNGWKNVSGIIGITAAMPQIKAAGGARMVFFYAGMISINLAFFNLLPFPGLDGWALLVTAVEGVTRKKMPQKAQTIVSLVGFALLIGLMVLILVKDVISLIV